MNIFLFCLGYLVLCGFMALALSKIPYRGMYWLAKDDVFRSSYNGVSAIFLASESGYCYSLTNLVKTAYSMGEVCVAPVFGSVFGYLYEMIYYFVMTNLVLAIFNLIPVPPLDGYHVLNDLGAQAPAVCRSARAGRRHGDSVCRVVFRRAGRSAGKGI